MKIGRMSKSQQEALKEELGSLFNRLGYTVVYGRGDFRDGSCVVNKDRKVVISQFTPLDLQIDFLAETLTKFDLSGIYVLPAIRKLIDERKIPDSDDSKLKSGI